MFKELYTMIDELHKITNTQPFAAVRYRHELDKLFGEYEKISKEIGAALLPVIKTLIRKIG